LSAEALGRHLQGLYSIGEVRACVLLQHNLNDTYLVETTTGRYVLRVSQAPRPTGASWRTLDDLLFEVDVLLHLARKGVPVAAPVSQRDGAYASQVYAPEGVRHVVLFTYAAGDPVSAPKQTESLAQRYGQAVARLHVATEDFASPHPRFALDLDFLLTKPLTIVTPFLADRPADWQYVHSLATTLAERLDELHMSGLEQGLCHGDVQGGNAHLAPDGTLTFFDFDVCGLGWRAYDIAVFCWGAALGKVRLGWEARTVDGLRAAYLSGYEAVRPLRPVEQEAIDALVLLRQYWYLGLEVGHWDTWGVSELGRAAFFDREVAFMHAWATEHHLVR
jgi:Ser/Thr protein kinase RdoA (MazF antagonist)